MNAIVYVNTPLEAREHAALADLARREGRAKGQQLRLLAIQAMRGNGKGKACGGGGGSSAVIGTAGSDSASGPGNGKRKRERASSAASRRGDRGTAGGVLAPAGEALGAVAAGAAAVRESKSRSRTAIAEKGGRV